MDKVLHVIPDNYNDFTWQEKIKAIPVEERDNAGLWYLHGELERKFNYDKATITNCKTLGLSKPYEYGDNQFINKLYLNGTINCEVEGADEPCIGFFYTIQETDETHWIQKGLVCLKNDTNACHYAEKKMIEKAIIS